MEMIMVLLAHIGIYYLLDCNYPLPYEVGLNVFYYIFYEEFGIPVDILAHFIISLEQFNKYNAVTKISLNLFKSLTSHKLPTREAS